MNSILIKTVLTALVSASLLLSPTAFAGYNNSYMNKHNKHYSKQKSQHYKQYKKNKSKHNYTGEIIGGIIGGVVLGTILSDSSRNTHVTTTYNNARYNNNRHYKGVKYKRPIQVNKTIIVNNTPTQTYRVLNGSDCYLVNYNNNGSEILTQVPNVNCGF